MLKKFISKLYLLVVIVVALCWSCTKLDTTTLGGDLIPVVDNVNTFEQILDITATQGIFADTTRTNLLSDHVLGTISNDPLFGTTKADIYVQLKPSAFPFRYGSIADTLSGFGAGLDSVVLCLSYKGYWGDFTIPQSLQVRQVSDINFADSTQYYDNDLRGYVANSRPITYRPNTLSTLLGSTIVDMTKLKDTIPVGGSVFNKEKVINQIRIKLSPAFAASIYNLDTSAASPFNSDSAFRRLFNGFEIKAGSSGNALMYTSLSSTNTRLEVHYRKRYAGKVDTVSTSFKLQTFASPVIKLSAAANNITRGISGFPASNPTADELYLQTTPGTYVNLSIPGISGYDNRIIHRAELVVQQIPNNPVFDTMFRVPDYVYVDLIDTSASPNWKPIYIDLNPNTAYDPDVASAIFPSAIDFGYYGGFRRDKVDKFGNKIQYYNINVTRHLQRIVTKRTPNYKFRLFAPYVLNYSSYKYAIPYNNNIALGRAKIGSGTNNDYKMYLRVIYSKL